jgi:ubiquinone/menaquinone biosynthesis C-methylase UbiE
MNDNALRLEYLDQVPFRDPTHPVVGAYADPKIQFIGQYSALRGRVLDVGRGNGIFTLRLANVGADVTWLDYSRHLLKDAYSRLSCGDATSLPDENFELVFEANLLHQVAGPERVIREMARRDVVLIEPNGYNTLIFAFSLVVRSERRVLKSCVSRLKANVARRGLRVVKTFTTQMISQNNAPTPLVPILNRFDRPICWGEYLVLIAEKPHKRFG